MSPEIIAGFKVMGYGLIGVFSTLILLYVSIVLMKIIIPFEKREKKKK